MKIFTGEVISNKMAKTATVAVDRIVEHPVYKKRYKTTKKYHVHDEIGTKIGDRVQFVACKPYSKIKKWKVIKIVGEKKIKKDNLKNVVKKNQKTAKTATKKK